MIISNRREYKCRDPRRLVAGRGQHGSGENLITTIKFLKQGPLTGNVIFWVVFNFYCKFFVDSLTGPCMGKKSVALVCRLARSKIATKFLCSV